MNILFKLSEKKYRVATEKKFIRTVRKGDDAIFTILVSTANEGRLYKVTISKDNLDLLGFWLEITGSFNQKTSYG